MILIGLIGFTGLFIGFILGFIFKESDKPSQDTIDRLWKYADHQLEAEKVKYQNLLAVIDRDYISKEILRLKAEWVMSGSTLKFEEWNALRKSEKEE